MLIDTAHHGFLNTEAKPLKDLSIITETSFTLLKIKIIWTPDINSEQGCCILKAPYKLYKISVF